ncbi:hypothetical protein KL921_004211 [Ogataea angusta]|uniref:Small ribosomal subunit protein uS9m n=1 Tax=Pichia angusta TaxID=870730 RepID=A0AAN6DDE3_PICAN|nr:uncharacterized protein KL928_004501 [Ogataea angusta]KAG7807453.1 hypothetical protein KL921_004211 [Ogataea angusta]KAG7816459.1 hypothetical protein KL928_004501 [Ogataea angusta]KAG7828046.1 hypothetical protein KL920_003773 [Ogataea angusta]KAG7833088.1 hypothetical protein KL943_004536 [Ogataea angusta]KAG7837709.1 hypothetical protein KL942_004121 [Ogataea angusta]
MLAGRVWKARAGLTLRVFARQLTGGKPRAIEPVFQYGSDGSIERDLHLEKMRLIPPSPTVFARNPFHEDVMEFLLDLLNKYASLPYSKKNTEKSVWLSFEEYKRKGNGAKCKQAEYNKLKQTLVRLDSIDPQLRSPDLEHVLDFFKVSKTMRDVDKKIKELDSKGRAVATGGRKDSSAKVYVVEGEGTILVNGLPFDEKFKNLKDRTRILYPLQIVESETKYNIFALSRGGGSTGQADAVRLAIARALVIHNPLFEDILLKAGCLYRDPRSVERKKPGKLKARKSPTWVKR